MPHQAPLLLHFQLRLELVVKFTKLKTVELVLLPLEVTVQKQLMTNLRKH
jgi:hypothetical protein